MSFNEAMRSLEVPDDAPAEEKLKAVCQWFLGDPMWSEEILYWLEKAGYEVTSKNKKDDQQT